MYYLTAKVLIVILGKENIYIRNFDMGNMWVVWLLQDYNDNIENCSTNIVSC